MSTPFQNDIAPISVIHDTISPIVRRAPLNSHQTTVRFSEEMWSALELASARSGVSVAQYLRDAARARLADEEAARQAVSSGELALREVERVNAIEHSFEHAEHSAALWEQGRLARERARLLREEGHSRRSQLR
jgi:predicted DNA-binding protein